MTPTEPHPEPKTASIRNTDSPSATSAAQVWQPHRYETRAGFVPAGGAPVLELLAARAGEQILDLGCGAGSLTRLLAETGAHVLGIDSSAEMIHAAREAYPELNFEVRDGESLDYRAAFDAVFSNAALHWMQRPDAVARGVQRALRPGGRFVAEFGGRDNVRCVREAVEVAFDELGIPNAQRPPSPWYFPSLGEYSSLLEAAGFDVEFAHWFSRPSPMPDQEQESGIAAWLEIFAQPSIGIVSAAQRPAFFAAVERHARPHLFRDGTWWIDYVRLRFAARKRTSR